jgi:hypothetical protein
VKAKRFWDCGWTGIVKKASFKSRTVKWVVVPGMRDRRMQGLGTTGCIGVTAMLTKWKFCTNWEDPLGFFTGRIGVLQEEWVR